MIKELLGLKLLPNFFPYVSYWSYTLETGILGQVLLYWHQFHLWNYGVPAISGLQTRDHCVAHWMEIWHCRLQWETIYIHAILAPIRVHCSSWMQLIKLCLPFLNSWLIFICQKEMSWCFSYRMSYERGRGWSTPLSHPTQLLPSHHLPWQETLRSVAIIIYVITVVNNVVNVIIAY